MAKSLAERQRAHYQKQKEMEDKGLQRNVMFLPIETVEKLEALSKFYEIETHEIITKGVEILWEDRFSLRPTTKTRTPKVASDDYQRSMFDLPPSQEPEPEPEPEESTLACLKDPEPEEPAPPKKRRTRKPKTIDIKAEKKDQDNSDT